jgi:tetratricopeptide (TPR) repeat protein
VAAEAYARRALSEDHPHIDSWRLLGFALGVQQRYREALAVAEKAVAMDSSRASYELLAWTLVSGDLDVQRGIEVAKQAIDLPLGFLDVEKSLPHRVCAQHSLGHAYLKQGKTQLAVEYLEKAVVLQPRRACIQVDLQRATSAARGT